MKNLTSLLSGSFTVSRKLDYQTTTNRNVYNKLHKELNSCCSFCGWHKGENKTYDKWYGTKNFWRASSLEQVKYPSWKLVSKNKNQYDSKPITIWIKTNLIDGTEYKVIEF